MLRTIHKAVTASATSEGLVDLVTGGVGFKRRIVGVYYETIANVHFRMYVGTDRICEISGDIVNDGIQPIMIDRVLADGETVSMGWWNGTGSSVTHDIAVVIEEDTVV